MCGIAGTLNLEHSAVLLRTLGHSLQNRGRDGCGISTISRVADEYRFHCKKFPGPVARNFTENVIERLPGSEGIAHTRYATAANSDGTENLQPLFFKVGGVPFAIAHNGNFTNCSDLEQTDLLGTPFNTASDTERFLRLIIREHRHERSLGKSIARALSKLRGSCSAVLHTPGQLFAIRDGTGNRPLYWGKKDDGYVVASETCALDAVDVFDWQEVPPATIMCFSAGGIDLYELPKLPLKMCIFELVYFGFPTSTIFGVPVAKVRFNLGRMMARRHGIATDLIVAIPDSSIEMANGYAFEMRQGQPDNGAILRRHDTGRTFIMRGQSLRKKAVNEKFSFNTPMIRGKTVTTIDDSEVRGTTSEGIVQSLLNRGAKAVHWRNCSPMIIESCFYGIATADKSLLIAANMTLEEMRVHMRAASLAFLELSDFQTALAESGFVPTHGCYTCMDGIRWD